MPLKKIICLLTIFFCALNSYSQTNQYTVANAHSHNDYEQLQPFIQAYRELFGSVEADVYLSNNELLVAHEIRQLKSDRTLEKLYLEPINQYILSNAGHIYSDKNRSLQLLVDIKTEAVKTLASLIEILKKYPAIINNKNVHIVISGNRPPDSTYYQYPSYIWFDGRLNQSYSESALTKIALLSEDFNKFTKWKGTGAFLEADSLQISKMVETAHAIQKPVRLWAIPDQEKSWQLMKQLHVDYINTDKVAELADFLSANQKGTQLLPYNRIIRSAGEVIRYGKPELENHALDAALLPEEDLLVIEDRYGISTLNLKTKMIANRWSYTDNPAYSRMMSTYSGIKVFSANGKTWVVWSAAERVDKSALMIAEWQNGFTNFSMIPFTKNLPANNALPNDIAVVTELDDIYLYVVLNGNNELVKIKWSDKSIVWKSNTGVAPFGVTVANNKVFVSNWAGENATDSLLERAGVPWGLAYTDPRTGATSSGTVSVIDTRSGKFIKEINTGLHPNAVIASQDAKYVYVANGSSDEISVIHTKSLKITETIYVGLLKQTKGLQGSTPNALELDAKNNLLYVANGLDNAIAVVQLGKNASTNGRGNTVVTGVIPTEAFPGGIKLAGDQLVVTNLESDGANVVDKNRKARSIHNQLASVSIIPLPDAKQLNQYTWQVTQQNLLTRSEQLTPDLMAKPVPVPVRLGEPSVFKHVVYIIKENKTYDQVYGDMKGGNGDSSLCVFGNRITPNMHALAKQYGWMDQYYASGKSSAEGHQWTDAGMVSDYVEKSVRAWFRSYPHRQEDALVYNKSGFIWNQALDNGKTVRIFGEACETVYDHKLKWSHLYDQYKSGKQPAWYNSSTIARIRPIISPTFPDCDNIAFSDQQRADIFINEWKESEKNNTLPNLMVVSLPNDHSAGTSPDFPTPNAMVADNDLAVGRIVEMISKSKYWDSTVIFITQDDSQGGWDHISAYRTVGLVISPYSTGKINSSNYNQTSMLRTIEQILGIPPMNMLDATARIMTDCFQSTKNTQSYNALKNNIPLDEMNKSLNALRGKERRMALQSQNEVFNEVDGGEDDTMNKIIWYYAKGDQPYPSAGKTKK